MGFRGLPREGIFDPGAGIPRVYAPPPFIFPVGTERTLAEDHGVAPRCPIIDDVAHDLALGCRPPSPTSTDADHRGLLVSSPPALQRSLVPRAKK